MMADMNSSENIAFVECSDAMNSLERAIKRLIDVIVSFCGIIVLYCTTVPRSCAVFLRPPQLPLPAPGNPAGNDGRTW